MTARRNAPSFSLDFWHQVVRDRTSELLDEARRSRGQSRNASDAT